MSIVQSARFDYDLITIRVRETSQVERIRPCEAELANATNAEGG